MENEYTKKLQDYIRRNGVDCSLFTYDDSCHSVQAACKATGAAPEEFVKSICFMADDGIVVAIVRGCDRVLPRRIGEALEAPVPRIARACEVLSHTGFPAGGVPPIGFDACFLIDEAVLELPCVWAGGGSDSGLIKIAPEEIIRHTGARRTRLT
ncbi:hypothetical protein EF808_06965 [archaeon]|nr:MAG: hypothetical protein EF808_06965 [archaeon]